ncbi:MAG: TrkH family potassium uptake protein [Gammaproteobacteria bacterium]|nr:TrkH family potassium uptake protein [Gammaproteobacteria bacterium]
MAPRERYATLAYAVRGRVLAKYLAQLGLAVAVLTAPLAAATALLGDGALAWRLALVALAFAALSGPGARLREPAQLQTNEALAVLASAFVLTPLAMAWPMHAAGLPWIDAVFESVSGVTTTGLSTVPDAAAMPRGFWLARAWMQWYGGLGVAVLSVVLVAGHHAAARRLVDVEAPEGLVTTTRLHARRVLLVYLVLTLIGVALLLGLGHAPLVSVAHVLSAVSTGGFSTHRASLAGFTGAAPAVVLTGLGLAGAVSLPLYHRAYLQGWRALHADPELRALVLAALALSALLAGSMLARGLPGDLGTVGHALALGVSAQTTTGFSTLSPGELAPAEKALMLLAMSVGGSVGSTAGGVKLLRVLILLRVVQLAVRRTGMPPHAVAEPRIAARLIEPEDVNRALVLLLLFVAVVFVSWLAFLAAGYHALDALFEVVSATGTVGLSTGITGTGLPAPLKGVLCLDMLFGRLEVVALLVVLYPRTWLGRRAETP